MADDTVYTISVHEGSAKSWAIGRIEMLGSNSLNELAAVLCESMLPKAGRPDDNGIDEHMWKFEVCRREWERDDDFRPASRPASQQSTTTQLAALLARPKHPLVVGGDEPFTFLYDYGTQSRLELRVVSAKPKPRISNAALAGAPGTNLAAAALRLLQPEPYPRIAYFDNDAVATGRQMGLDEKYPTFARAFLDPLHSSTLGLSSMTRSEDNGTFASIEKKSVIYPKFEDDQGSLNGKTYAVTGCTTGTGLVVAKLFAKKGAARVFLLNRPSQRAEAALAAVQAVAAEECVVTHVDCDLADFDSVRQAAAQVAAETEESGLDVLANNAGVMALADRATKDGYDIQMQTNHLSHFLLTRELYPVLVKAVALRGEARIVNHSSFARNGPPGTMLTAENCKLYLGKNGGDLGGDGSSMICGGARWVRYAYTKLANVCFTLALHDKLGDSGVKALCAAPGLAATRLQATTDADGGMGSGTWFMRWSQSPEDGAVPLLHCCLSSAVNSGELWEPKGMTGAPVLKDPLEKVCLEADRVALWAASEAAVGEWDLDL